MLEIRTENGNKIQFYKDVNFSSDVSIPILWRMVTIYITCCLDTAENMHTSLRMFTGGD